MIACSPYLGAESRLVSLAAALRPLGTQSLGDPYARRAAFFRAALAPVGPAEDREARRRAELRLKIVGAGA